MARRRRKTKCKYRGVSGKKELFRTTSYGAAARLASALAKRNHQYVRVFGSCAGSREERMLVCTPDGSCGTYALEGTRRRRRRKRR